MNCRWLCVQMDMDLIVSRLARSFLPPSPPLPDSPPHFSIEEERTRARPRQPPKPVVLGLKCRNEYPHSNDGVYKPNVGTHPMWVENDGTHDPFASHTKLEHIMHGISQMGVGHRSRVFGSCVLPLAPPEFKKLPPQVHHSI